MSRYTSYNFQFSYWSRSYAKTVIWQGLKLLFTGRCTMNINMTQPRDLAGMEAFEDATRAFDIAQINRVLPEGVTYNEVQQ